MANGISVGAGGIILRDGAPYRGIGINYFSAFSRRLKDAEDTSYREGFAELAKHDIPFVRFMAGGFWPVDYDLYMSDKEAYFKLMDDVVATAGKHGVGLIPSLSWYTACVPDLVGEPRSAWGDPESKTMAFMRAYTEEVVLRYVDSEAIWAWEFGNEYSLAADLPNAAEHRPWIHPELGTATTRSEADDMTQDMVVTALREFAEVVRRFDARRPITTGNSLPRSAAHHLRAEGAWTQDSREEFAANLLEVTPDLHDLVSIHLYPHDHEGRFGQSYTAYEELLHLSMEAAGRAGKTVFVGEFGAPDSEKPEARDAARRENFMLLNAIELEEAPLAALWNFDLPQQEATINVSATNHRSYLLSALQEANRRIKYVMEGGHHADLESGALRGRLRDNLANAGRAGGGLNPLYYGEYLGKSIYREDSVGLNFEHIFNGTDADAEISMFTPRKDPCTLVRHSERSATLHWPAEDSAWGVDCSMRYTFESPGVVDLECSLTPTREHFPLGYAAFMWASYMNRTRDRKIHFWGMDGEREGWVSFGENTAEGFETGTISYAGVDDLPYEADSNSLNIVEHPTKKFSLPFYYGLVDGDGALATEGDTLAYIMMFDRCAPIRFAMWNFIADAAGRPDPHSPAWDWQFVVRKPEQGKTYGYRARVVIKPFTSPEDIREAYKAWAGQVSGS